MVAIPPSKDTDAEDVVWGLQTAEALWKRGERIDAIVWLRRAAQAADEAADDDRALELARAAAELSDWMATRPPGESRAPVAMPVPTGLPPAYDANVVSTFVPYGEDEEDEPTPLKSLAPTLPPPIPRVPSVPSRAPQEQVRTEPPVGRASSSPPRLQTEPHFPDVGPPQVAFQQDERGAADSLRPSTTSVLPAEHVHAGMFNPWDEDALPAAVPVSAPSAPPSLPALSSRPSPRSLPAAAPVVEREELVTSLHEGPAPHQRADAADDGLSKAQSLSMPPKAAPGKPPPLPPRARKPPPPAAASAPSVPAPSASQAEIPPGPVTEPGLGDAPSEPPSPGAVPAKLDLQQVEAFADLPDDARDAFAAAAAVSALGEGEEVSGFALAYILSGTVDVAATMVDAPAARLAAGAVLRSRGTMEEGVPMRLIGVSSGVVATWTDAEVQDAFRTCPWVEEDLRTAADRLQTLVGVTIGPLGERLDAYLREQIIGRLTMRTLAPGDVVVTAGQPVPGLLLVGIGELELVDPSRGDAVAGVVGSGEFLFAGEVLGAGAAPHTARAGAGGALILFGDRMIAQELLVTCPPLLEVFAGM
jgi:hypothetical protein